MRNTNTTVRNLEHHIAQISKLIEERFSSSLPNNMEIHPMESLKAMTLRSGKQLQGPIVKEPELEIIDPQLRVSQLVDCDLKAPIDCDRKEKAQDEGRTSLAYYQPKLPYPMKVNKDQQEQQYKKSLDVFKTLHINDPFVEALTQIPKYAKFLKELLTNKQKLQVVSSVTLCKECSALITNKLPKKENDMEGFIILFMIGGIMDEKALANLVANINLIPNCIFQKLGLDEMKSTTMTLQLFDQSTLQP